jgi:hypothetical protein
VYPHSSEIEDHLVMEDDQSETNHDMDNNSNDEDQGDNTEYNI